MSDDTTTDTGGEGSAGDESAVEADQPVGAATGSEDETAEIAVPAAGGEGSAGDEPAVEADQPVGAATGSEDETAEIAVPAAGGEGSASDESAVEADQPVGAATGSEDETADTAETATTKTTLTVTVDGADHEVEPGGLVIQACLDNDAYVPHFCWHPRMSSVGMCRQCLVEVEGPRGPMMVVSCMTPAADGQVVNTKTDGVKRAQEGVLELLLANHPLDCPVCDKGGECPLQDQAFSHGPGESRYLEEKRHYEKPIPISELVYLDRERCILCDRCTRFADEVAGDRLIHFVSRGNDTQVMTFPDEPFVSYFSGNTVQICPVGALTAKPYRFKARPWDLDQRESTCTTCSVGCRTVIQSSRDELLRYQGIDSDPVNWGWLCDRGRFNFESVNSEHRLTQPMVRTDAGLIETTWNAALDGAVALVREVLADRGPNSIAILGGARGTNEDAFAWAQLADAIGIPHRDAQYGDGLPAAVLGLDRATIDETANASTIVLLGPDLKEELPVLYLRLRDAAEKRRSRILEFSSLETGLTPYAWKSIRHQPGAQPGAVARALADDEIAAQLAAGDVVIVAGRPNLAESADATMSAVAEMLEAVPGAKVLPALRRGNVVGALSVGMAPTAPERDGLAAVTAAAAGKIDLLVLLGADPLNDCPDADVARRALAAARRIISIDTMPNESTQLADVVLAAAAYGEKSGTTTNLEGRVTTIAQKVTPAGTVRPDWMVALELGQRLGEFGADHPLGDVVGVDDITDAIAANVAGFGAVTREALAGATDGVMTDVVPTELPEPWFTVAGRNSYDYRLVVSRKLYDRAVGTAMSRSLSNLAPGPGAHLHPLDLETLGVPAGAEVKIASAQAAAVLTAIADPAVQRGVVWVPFNQGGGRIENIVDADSPVTDVRIEAV